MGEKWAWQVLVVRTGFPQRQPGAETPNACGQGGRERHSRPREGKRKASDIGPGMLEEVKGWSGARGSGGHALRWWRQAGLYPASLLPQPSGHPHHSLSGWVDPVTGHLGWSEESGSAKRRGLLFPYPPRRSPAPASLPQNQAQRLVSNFSGCQPRGVRLKLLIPNHYHMGIRLPPMVSNGLLFVPDVLSMKDFSLGLGFE